MVNGGGSFCLERINTLGFAVQIDMYIIVDDFRAKQSVARNTSQCQCQIFMYSTLDGLRIVTIFAVT